MTIGSVAVDIFFITSGFLVTGSLISRGSTLEFLWARALRIYPALVVAVLLIVFGLGLYFTSYPWLTYLTSRGTLAFALKNSTAIIAVAWTLPGVFHPTHARGMVDVPLWTLGVELRMYVLLAVLWAGVHLFRNTKSRVFNFVVMLIAGSSLLARFANAYYIHSVHHNDLVRLMYMFFIGATYFLLKERIILSRAILLAALAALCLSVWKFDLFFAVYNIVLPYLLFWTAYIPAGAIRNFNRLGDYSYGVYIYSFPIQQSVVELYPGIGVMGLLLCSSAGAFLLAFLSWHLIEKRALSLKGSFPHLRRGVVEEEPAKQLAPAQ